MAGVIPQTKHNNKKQLGHETTYTSLRLQGTLGEAGDRDRGVQGVEGEEGGGCWASRGGACGVSISRVLSDKENHPHHAVANVCYGVT